MVTNDSIRFMYCVQKSFQISGFTPSQSASDAESIKIHAFEYRSGFYVSDSLPKVTVFSLIRKRTKK